MWCWLMLAKEAILHAEGCLPVKGTHDIFRSGGQDAGFWWLHQTPVSVELLGSAVAAGLQWHP